MLPKAGQVNWQSSFAARFILWPHAGVFILGEFQTSFILADSTGLPGGAASQGLNWSDVAISFYALVLEGSPFLLIGAIISGLIDVFLPTDRVRAWLPKSKGQGIAAAIVAGVFFPLCECGTMPVVQRLIRKGVSPAVATMYLLSAPALNPLAMIATWLAFRNQDPGLMVILRVGFSLAVLAFIGTWLMTKKPQDMLRPEILIGRASAKTSSGDDLISAPRAGYAFGAWQQFTGAVTRDFLGVLVYLIIGAGVAAVFSAGFNRSVLAPVGQSPWLGPLAGILLSQLLCLCSTTDAFIIAAFVPFSVAAKIAFLVAGPLIDLKLYWLYRSAFQASFVQGLWKRAIIVTFLLTLLYALHEINS